MITRVDIFRLQCAIDSRQHNWPVLSKQSIIRRMSKVIETSSYHECLKEDLPFRKEHYSTCIVSCADIFHAPLNEMRQRSAREAGHLLARKQKMVGARSATLRRLSLAGADG